MTNSTKDDFDRIYAQFPELPEDRRRDWAERVVHTPTLLYAYSGSAWPYPFANEDYTEDPK